MSDYKTMEEANPIFNTAKYTLQWLTKAGVPEAKKYNEKLGFSDAQIEANLTNTKLAKLFAVPNIVLHHARYDYINRQIELSGCRNILDIACGY